MPTETADRSRFRNHATFGPYLIVNADDFGLSAGINEGIIYAHQHGIVTSASLMVRHAAAEHAVELAVSHPMLDLGLHLDFGEWRCHRGAWVSVYERISLEDPVAILDETVSQLELFRALTGRLPTHVDSHQHVHVHEPARTIVKQVFDERDILIRHLAPAVHYCGDFYGQTGSGDPLPELITASSLTALLSRLPSGITELNCHPGFDDHLDTSYAVERRREVTALCSSEAQATLNSASVVLISFASAQRFFRGRDSFLTADDRHREKCKTP